MIELAPQHKVGLPLANPVMIAGGFGGYGQAYRPLLNLSAFGALVSNPITLRPQRGTAQPRLVETTAGFVLDTGAQNPGVKKVIREYSKQWRGWSLPVIAHLPADEPDDLKRTARALGNVESVAAIELGLPPQASPRDLEQWMRAIREGCMLPLLVKLPLELAIELAEMEVVSAADALVIGSPPLAAAQTLTGQIVGGYLYGPALHSMVLYSIQIICDLVDVPLVAAGGIHTLADAQAYLAAGASAVQLDSLLWIEPQQAVEIAAALRL